MTPSKYSLASCRMGSAAAASGLSGLRFRTVRACSSTASQSSSS